jgi:hypothetical protein
VETIATTAEGQQAKIYKTLRAFDYRFQKLKKSKASTDLRNIMNDRAAAAAAAAAS